MPAKSFPSWSLPNQTGTRDFSFLGDFDFQRITERLRGHVSWYNGPKDLPIFYISEHKAPKWKAENANLVNIWECEVVQWTKSFWKVKYQPEKTTKLVRSYPRSKSTGMAQVSMCAYACVFVSALTLTDKGQNNTAVQRIGGLGLMYSAQSYLTCLSLFFSSASGKNYSSYFTGCRED